jgi:hypothetical protein
LGNHTEPRDEKPLSLIIKLIEWLKRTLKIEASTESRMKNFISNLPKANLNAAMKYTEISSKIADLERSERIQVNKIESSEEKNPLHDLERRDSGYESPLNEGSGYKEISIYQEKMGKNLPINPEQLTEEPIYATVSQEYIDEKRNLKQEQQQKPKPLNTTKAINTTTSANENPWCLHPS